MDDLTLLFVQAVMKEKQELIDQLNAHLVGAQTAIEKFHAMMTVHSGLFDEASRARVEHFKSGFPPAQEENKQEEDKLDETEDETKPEASTDNTTDDEPTQDQTHSSET